MSPILPPLARPTVCARLATGVLLAALLGGTACDARAAIADAIRVVLEAAVAAPGAALETAPVEAAPARSAPGATRAAGGVRLPAYVRGSPDAVSAAVMRAVRADYAARGHAPRFVEATPPFRATVTGREAVALLGDAAARGLDPADYGAARLRDALEAPRDDAGAARLEAALATALARHLADAGFGRIDPRAMGHDLPAQRRRDGLEPALRAALAAPTPEIALATIEPSLPPYRPLLAALAQWRERAAMPAPAPLPEVRGKVTPGDAWAGVGALRARLRLEGDLAGDPPGEGIGAIGSAAASAGTAAAGTAGMDGAAQPRYEGALVDAVRRFQTRHGLEADGVIGQRTLAALAVPAADRVRQIVLSLERLRWLGATPDGRFVAVNVPEFRLWAVDGGRVATSMAVVVGRTVSATPVFVDAIEAVELNPYWNVPRSIASRELYPKLIRDPGWLGSERMDLIGRGAAPDGDLRRALATGAARLRQQPGPGNALGRVKFVMPNAHDVYLHDTPSRAAFAASRRDFSHGCIRLHRPFDLVAFALADRPDWTAARVDAVVADGRNRVIPLTRPIPVLIFYSTVNVGKDGAIRFLPDIYGLDVKLDAALAGR